MIRKILRRGAIAVAVSAVMVVGAVTSGANAAPAHHYVSITAHTSITHRGDSAGDGTTWANDTMTRTITIKQTGATSYVATVTDKGTFATVAGASVPNQGGAFAGVKLAHVVSGSLHGSAAFAFTANRQPIARNVPVHVSGNSYSTSTWYELAFPTGTVFGGPGIGSWGWGYTTNARTVTVEGVTVALPAESWVDAAGTGGQVATDGNITGALTLG